MAAILEKIVHEVGAGDEKKWYTKKTRRNTDNRILILNIAARIVCVLEKEVNEVGAEVDSMLYAKKTR